MVPVEILRPCLGCFRYPGVCYLLVQICKALSRYSGSCRFNAAERKEKTKLSLTCSLLPQNLTAVACVFLWNQDADLMLHWTAMCHWGVSSGFRSTEVMHKGQPGSSFNRIRWQSSSSDCSRNCTCSAPLPCCPDWSFLLIFATKSSGHSFTATHSSSHEGLLTSGLLEISLYSSSWLSSSSSQRHLFANNVLLSTLNPVVLLCNWHTEFTSQKAQSPSST